MNAECSDLCRCIGCQNCKPNDEPTRETQLGKRKRSPQSLLEVNLNEISQEIAVPSSQPEYGYYSKPRKAKENRYIKSNDFIVEPIVRQKI